MVGTFDQRRRQQAAGVSFRRAWLTLLMRGSALGLGLGLGLAGCADMNDSLSVAFADPAKYELYDCKQLEAERKNLANRSAELQGLMAKAQTGAAGPVVSELAYRNEYISVRGQSRNAEDAWQRNNCRETPAEPAVVPPVIKPAGKRSSR